MHFPYRFADSCNSYAFSLQWQWSAHTLTMTSALALTLILMTIWQQQCVLAITFNLTLTLILFLFISKFPLDMLGGWLGQLDTSILMLHVLHLYQLSSPAIDYVPTCFKSQCASLVMPSFQPSFPLYLSPLTTFWHLQLHSMALNISCSTCSLRWPSGPFSQCCISILMAHLLSLCLWLILS